MASTFARLFHIPNLLSLSRIGLAPLIGYFLSQDDPRSTVICLTLLLLAAATDGLDGYLARRMNLQSRLGEILDPVADKIMAATLIVFLIMFREFPLWLATLIVCRDLVLLAAGAILIKGSSVSLPSNLVGKYCFASIIALLISYVIRFSDAIAVYTLLTLALLAASSVSYLKVFIKVRRGETPTPFIDRPIYRILRIAGLILLVAWLAYRAIFI